MNQTFNAATIEILKPYPDGFRKLSSGVIVSHVNAEGSIYVSTRAGRARVTFRAKNGYGSPIPAGYTHFQVNLLVENVFQKTLLIPASNMYQSVAAELPVPTKINTKITFKWINDYTGAGAETHLDIESVKFEQTEQDLIFVAPAMPGFGNPLVSPPPPVGDPAAPSGPAAQLTPDPDPQPATSKPWIGAALITALLIWIVTRATRRK